MRSSILFSTVSCLFLFGCGAEVNGTDPAGDEVETTSHALLAPERSFAVTHQKFLKPFTLERVLDQLVTLSGVTGLTALDLFQQMWDTQNDTPNAAGPGPHCDDQLTWQGVPGLNDFPWECPRFGGYQATIDPFGSDPLFIPIGLFNRFDLAPATGAHCGEYRIVFAQQPGHPLALGNGRNFIIFEAILPNPNPHLGLAACEPVAKLWHDFTFMSDASMAGALEKFYFDGLFGFAPVVHPHHYGLMLGANGYACSSGQIRTNQFNADPWTMREYKLALDCRCGPCDLRMIPLTVKTNPYPELFASATIHPLATTLHSTVVSEIGPLSANDPNRISWSVDDKLNAAESPIDVFSDYTFQASGNPALHSAITMALPAGSPLTSTNIIDRALTQSCAGCHLLSDGRNLGDGVVWPFSLGFTHISEFITMSGEYPISQALQDVFIPFREQILLDFLANPHAFPGSGARCELQLPPDLVVPPDLCAEVLKDVELLPSLTAELSNHTGTLRKLRVQWEGRTILGRRSGH